MIFHIEDPNFYSQHVIGFGVEEFAKMLEVPYIKYTLSDSVLRPYEHDCILVLEGFQFRGESQIINHLGRDVDNIRKILPKVKIIVFGSYSTHCNEYIEYNHPSKTDLHLDTSLNVALSFQDRGICADMFLWSVTKSVYEQAKVFVARLYLYVPMPWTRRQGRIFL
jgi:hypothetical protein